MKIIQKIPKKWLIFIWILVVHLMGLLDYTLMVPLIPNITKTIGIPASQGGLWVSICALTMGITALVLSPLSDMLGRRKTLLIGLSILMISACFCGMAQNFWTLIILRGVSGVGWALILPTVIGYISDLFESEKRAMVLGIDLAFSFFAVIIGVPIYTYIAQESSWRITFLFHSFCLCFVVLLTFLIPKNPTKIVSTPSQTNHLRLIKTALMDRTVVLTMLLWIAVTSGYWGYITYIGIFYTKNFNFNVAQIGQIFTLTGFGYVLGALIGGKIATKLGKTKIARFAFIIASMGALGFSLLTQNVILATIVIFLASVNFGTGDTAIASLVSELNPTFRGTTLSIAVSFIAIGVTLVTTASSRLIDHGFFYVGLMCASVSAMGLFILKLLGKETKKKALQTHL